MEALESVCFPFVYQLMAVKIDRKFSRGSSRRETKRRCQLKQKFEAARSVLTFKKRSNSISVLKRAKGGTFRNVELASEIKKFETRMEEEDGRTKTPKKSRKEKWLFWNFILQRVDSLLSSTCFM